MYSRLSLEVKEGTVSDKVSSSSTSQKVKGDDSETALGIPDKRNSIKFAKVKKKNEKKEKKRRSSVSFINFIAMLCCFLLILTIQYFRINFLIFQNYILKFLFQYPFKGCR
jgi:hypothetical protein